MNTFGNMFRVTIFGESHGPAIGAVVDGTPAGTRIDLEAIQREMNRRAPGRAALSTPRQEADVPEILSGMGENGVATGAPITCVIRNHDARPQDYPSAFRPGHADWPAFVKYGGHADRRGGGRFSGRLTAGLVFAGAIAKTVLAARGIEVFGRIKSISNAYDNIEMCGENAASREELRRIAAKIFPAADNKENDFLDHIAWAKEENDSVGGVVEAVCFGVPAGAGEPFFSSMESRIASMVFSIPAVKGVEFGRGFEITTMRGREANDPLVLTESTITTRTNNNGGVLGGIANGMPVIVRAAIKPTSSISVPQQTIDPATGAETTLILGGRHDPCIAPRAVPVVEAGVAIAVLDLIMEGGLC